MLLKMSWKKLSRGIARVPLNTRASEREEIASRFCSFTVYGTRGFSRRHTPRIVLVSILLAALSFAANDLPETIRNMQID